jgi:hypothetical protein
MSVPASNTEDIVEELAAISGVMRDDIHVSDNTVTTYIPRDKLEVAEALEDIDVEILEEHEHEYLISANSAD